MKSLILITCLFFLFGCNSQREKERHIRKSINKYLGKIGVKNQMPRDYFISFKECNERDFIAYLKNENSMNCESSIETHSATILEHRKKFESGRPLTPQELEYDSTKPNTLVFKAIEDSLSKLTPDLSKNYYNVFAFQLQGKDTVWKNNFWLDGHYKIVW